MNSLNRDLLKAGLIITDSISATKNLTKTDKKLISWGKRNGKIEGESGILLNGVKLVEEALAADHPLHRAWHTSSFADTNPALLHRLNRQGCDIKLVNQRLMKLISDLDTPPGIAAVGSQPGFIFRQPKDSLSLIVAVSTLQDPGNLGGVVRSADYFGVDEVWLDSNSVDPYSPKALRGSMGAIFRLPIVRNRNLKERIIKFQQAGSSVWAAVPHDASAERHIIGSGSRILLIGGESKGLNRSFLDLADHKVSIPGARRSESLNLAVAVGILIYQATSGRY